MADENVSHDDVVNAVRAALLNDLKQVKFVNNSEETKYRGSADNVLKLAQAYEHVMRANSEYL